MAKRQRSVDPPLAPLLPFWEDSSSSVLGILALSPEAKFQLELLWTLLDVKRDATRVQIKKANMKLLKKCVACAPKPGNGAIPGGARFVRNTR